MSDLYYKAVVAYRAGDYTAASKYLGTLSHYYSDVCQPFHTTENANYYRKLHVEYEYDVDDFQHKLGNKTYWVTPGRPSPSLTSGHETISAAQYARARYKPLRDSFRKSHRWAGALPIESREEVQSRAANDLADIIRTIPTGGGLAPCTGQGDSQPLRIRIRDSTSRSAAYVRCVDASGTPMEGVGVKLVWNLPTGTKTLLRYSDSNGEVEYWQNIGEVAAHGEQVPDGVHPASGETTRVARALHRHQSTGQRVLRVQGDSVELQARDRNSTQTLLRARARHFRPTRLGSGRHVHLEPRRPDGALSRHDRSGRLRTLHSRRGEHASGRSANFTAQTQAGGQNRVARASFVPQVLRRAEVSVAATVGLPGRSYASTTAR